MGDEQFLKKKKTFLQAKICMLSVSVKKKTNIEKKTKAQTFWIVEKKSRF